MPTLAEDMTNKGRHTTTHRELFTLENGALIIDNPGMREVGLTDLDQGVKNVFDEIASLAKRCKFADCTHIHETGCAVLEALQSGKLDQAKYDNYIKLKKETDYYALTSLEKRQKDKKFGKMVNTVMKLKKRNN